MSAISADRTEISRERLRWRAQLGGVARGLDIVPGAFSKSVWVEIDGHRVGRLAKPTRQRPWREATFHVDGEPVLVGLTWHFPVMRTDVFVGERSLRDGRSLETVRSEAPKALTNYEVCIGALFGAPRWHVPRWWGAVVVACLSTWVVAIAVSPVAPESRFLVAAPLVVSSALLIISFVWSWSALGARIYDALMSRPSLGDWRIALWFVAFVAYPLLAIASVVLIAVLVS